MTVSWVWEVEECRGEREREEEEGEEAEEAAVSISGHCPRKMQSSRNFQTMPKVMPCVCVVWWGVFGVGGSVGCLGGGGGCEGCMYT